MLLIEGVHVHVVVRLVLFSVIFSTSVHPVHTGSTPDAPPPFPPGFTQPNLILLAVRIHTSILVHVC